VIFIIFKNHSNLEGTHAPFSASQSSWLRYTDEKILEVRKNMQAKEQGTRLHEWAAETIKLGIKMPRTKTTLNQYVNDAIGFRMTPEVVLYYSPYFYGTADTIYYNDKTKILRIHDLKTGKIPAHMDQLIVYAALFCLEYKVDPKELKTIDLSIYQCDDIIAYNPLPEEIIEVMNIIIHFDNVLREDEN
jgi:hypothetical protein